MPIMNLEFVVHLSVKNMALDNAKNSSIQRENIQIPHREDDCLPVTELRNNPGA